MTDSPPEGPVDWLRWFLTTDRSGPRFVRDFLSSVLAVLLVGAMLYGVSGVWPPMVAVESGSMEPHMHRGDLVFVMNEHRLTPSRATAGTGIVTYRTSRGSDYRKFGDHGDVIVYRPDGGDGTPIIHRARFWVNESENWIDKANPGMVPGTECSDVRNCPAPHAGFITKGDNNGMYDQVSGISGPVKPRWIRGTAELRIPWLGYIRLHFGAIRTSTTTWASNATSIA